MSTFVLVACPAAWLISDVQWIAVCYDHVMMDRTLQLCRSVFLCTSTRSNIFFWFATGLLVNSIWVLSDVLRSSYCV
jgi:hypothetical protein